MSDVEHGARYNFSERDQWRVLQTSERRQLRIRTYRIVDPTTGETWHNVSLRYFQKFRLRESGEEAYLATKSGCDFRARDLRAVIETLNTIKNHFDERSSPSPPSAYRPQEV